MAMVPLQRYENVASRLFGKPGTEHVLELTHERNMRFHNWFYAAFHEAWLNLPEHVTLKYPDETYLRYDLLIEAGYYKDDRRIIDDPDIMTKFVTQARTKPGAIVSVNGNVVVVRTPESQSVKDMGKERFEASAKAVLDGIAALIGVQRGELTKEAGRSA